MNRPHGTMAGWVALPVHQDELDSLLEALYRGADLMMHGPRRSAACHVADRLTKLHREFALPAIPNGRPT